MARWTQILQHQPAAGAGLRLATGELPFLKSLCNGTAPPRTAPIPVARHRRGDAAGVRRGDISSVLAGGSAQVGILHMGRTVVCGGGDFGTGGWCQPKCAGSVLAGTLGSSTAQGQLLAPGPKPIRNGPSSAPKRSAPGRRREGLAPGQEILAFSSSRAAVGSHNARFPRAAAKPRRDPGAGRAGEPQGRGTEAECRRAIRKPAPLLVPAAGTSLGRGRQQARHRPTHAMLALAVPAPAPGYLSTRYP